MAGLFVLPSCALSDHKVVNANAAAILAAIPRNEERKNRSRMGMGANTAPVSGGWRVIACSETSVAGGWRSEGDSNPR